MMDDTQSDTPDPMLLWSNQSPHQLLDEAQACLERDAPGAAMALLAAAQVQATVQFEWTFENRLIPGITNSIWEGMRQR